MIRNAGSAAPYVSAPLKENEGACGVFSMLENDYERTAPVRNLTIKEKSE